MSAELVHGVVDLWPEQVAVTTVLSPLAILRYQASQLRARTENLLQGEIRTVEDENSVKHEFHLVATALDRYRYLLLTVQHSKNRVYPVTVISDVTMRRGEWGDEHRVADTQEEFISLLSMVLSDQSTTSVVQSLIAQSNDLLHPTPEGV